MLASPELVWQTPLVVLLRDRSTYIMAIIFGLPVLIFRRILSGLFEVVFLPISRFTYALLCITVHMHLANLIQFHDDTGCAVAVGYIFKTLPGD